MGAAKKNTKATKKSVKTVYKKKQLKSKQLKSKKSKQVTQPKTIRAGSAFEKIHEFWTQLSASKRKLLHEVGDALLQNKSETRRIRVSLLPKPVKPKKQMTGFMLFAHENHEKLKSDHPDWKPTQLAQALGQAWNLLETDSKNDFKARKVTNTRVR